MLFFISPCTAMFHSACFGSAGRTAEHSPFAHMENKQWKLNASSAPDGERPLQKHSLGPAPHGPVPMRCSATHCDAADMRISAGQQWACCPPAAPASRYWLSTRNAALRGTELAVPLCWGDPPRRGFPGVLSLQPNPLPARCGWPNARRFKSSFSQLTSLCWPPARSWSLQLHSRWLQGKLLRFSARVTFSAKAVKTTAVLMSKCPQQNRETPSLFGCRDEPTTMSQRCNRLWWPAHGWIKICGGLARVNFDCAQGSGWPVSTPVSHALNWDMEPFLQTGREAGGMDISHWKTAALWKVAPYDIRTKLCTRKSSMLNFIFINS